MKYLQILYVFLLFSIVNCQHQKAENNEINKNKMSIKKQVEKGAFLVDVRSPEDFAQGSFPNAVNIPLEEVGNRVEEFKNKSSIITFCRSGNRSSQAIEILEKNGIQNITNGINVETMEQEMK